MYCPNCGVKINKLGLCEICGVDLQMLEKFNLIKDVPTKSDQSNIALFSRSLRRRSYAINEFIAKQKEYLENINKNKPSSNELSESGPSENKASAEPKINGRSLSSSVQKYKDSQEKMQPALDSSSSPKPNPQPAPVFSQETQPQSQSYNLPNTQSLPKSIIQPVTPQAEKVQAPSDKQEDEFLIPKLNNQQVTSNPQEPPQNNKIEADKNSIENNGDFVIPKLNNENNENSFANTNETIRKAENLSVLNKKELKKLKAKEKTQKKRKRKSCGIFALILSIIVALVVTAYVLSGKLRFGIGFLDYSLNFVETYSNYFIWASLLLTFFALLFNFIQLFMGSKKFRAIITLFILAFLGASWGYMYYIGQLIPSIKSLIEFVTNLF